MAERLTDVQEIAARLKASAEFAQALREMEQAMFESIVNSIEGTISEVATAKARDLANTAARSLMDQLTESQLNSMGDTIARALENGMRPVDIANQLREVQSLDSVRAKRYLKMQEYLEQSGLSDAKVTQALEREYQRLLAERRRTIAQTEGRVATSEARRVEAEERGYKWKVWATSQDGRVSDLCAGNQAAGVILLQDEFPSGAQQTPGHPGCRCSIAYIPDNPRVKRNAEIRNERAQKRTEKARAAYREEQAREKEKKRAEKEKEKQK